MLSEIQALTQPPTFSFSSITLSIILTILPVSICAQYSGGNGTEEDPYQIPTPADLDNVRNNKDAYFVQTANIDLDISPFNNNLGWEPIGNSSEPFSGIYDGQDFTIDSLFISRGNTNRIGLFGETTVSSEIKNLNLINVNVTGNESTGGLVGLSKSTIQNCSVTGSIIGKDLYTGGITGENESYIYKSYSDVNVTGTSRVGGIAGIIPTDNADIERSYSTGYITGEYWVGGITGSNYGRIIDSFTLASVTGNAYTAGISGGNFYRIIRSYAAGSITSHNTDAAGVAAYDDGDATVTDSYWDVNTTGVSSNSNGGTPLSTEEMKDSTNFSNFDFDTVWNIDEGYPFLRGVGELGSVPVSNDEYTDLSNNISLNQNYPNPFNPTTVISYYLPESKIVSLQIFNILGHKVATLVDQQPRSQGAHTHTFSAEKLSSGIYIYRLNAGDQILTKKFTLIK